MLRFLLRIAVYLSVVVVLMGGVIASGYLSSQKAFWGSVRQEPVPSLQGVQKPQHDPNKPTVVVLLGNENTEGLDFMIPYQLFSMTGAYNVYAVAEDNQVRSLTGGLDVVPHYSFKEMDELLGKSADIIAIPYMTMRDPKSYEPVRKWIAAQGNHFNKHLRRRGQSCRYRVIGWQISSNALANDAGPYQEIS
jgi:AraC family transcriptional regulator, transcriptional activator FtrA